MTPARTPALASIVLLILALWSWAGCAHIPSSANSQPAYEKIDLATVLQNPDANKGRTVVWGGVILEASVQEKETRLKILKTPLNSNYYPEDQKNAEGQFLARTSQSLDPKTCTPGEKITVLGHIIGVEAANPPGAQPVYPVIQIKQMRLWKSVSQEMMEKFPTIFAF